MMTLTFHRYLGTPKATHKNLTPIKAAKLLWERGFDWSDVQDERFGEPELKLWTGTDQDILLVTLKKSS